VIISVDISSRVMHIEGIETGDTEMKHAKGFTTQAKEFERMVRRDHPEAVISWELPLTMRKDGDAAGRAMVTKDGYKPKRYMVYATPRGHWEAF
jgi:hypothetical protein